MVVTTKHGKAKNVRKVQTALNTETGKMAVIVNMYCEDRGEDVKLVVPIEEFYTVEEG